MDEVQTGFFRTGKYFNITDQDLRPDILVFAKGVANGFPLSGIVSNREVSEPIATGALGGTYAGNAVACAAGVAVQEIFQSEPIAENVAARSAQLFTALRELQHSESTAHLIADVRGQGLMVAIEFRTPGDTLTHEGLGEGKSVPEGIAKRVQGYCMDHGLMIMTTSCFETIRFIPPLIVSEEEMRRGLEIFKAAMEHVANGGVAVGCVLSSRTLVRCTRSRVHQVLFTVRQSNSASRAACPQGMRVEERTKCVTDPAVSMAFTSNTHNAQPK